MKENLERGFIVEICTSRRLWILLSLIDYFRFLLNRHSHASPLV
jgi:hypothetical protein